jgi:hypothetical protein
MTRIIMKEDYPAPTHCFCEIPDEEMKPWVTKKFIDHQETVDLIKSTNDPHEKEIIGLVGLLDVDEETLLQIMKGVPQTEYHIINCRRHVKKILELDV